ncbi:MAG: TatD family hydrolase [Candidatus Paceibacterota bacterium]|jgi:TatD DNase family protein
MNITHFDAHAHTQFAAYDADRAEVMHRAYEAGVGMINVGTNYKTSIGAIELAHAYVNTYACIGYHPVHATPSEYHDKDEETKENFDTIEAFDYEMYQKLARDPKVVAIGECGLDYFRIEGDEAETKKKQKQVFEEQIKLVHEIQKPLMIHCRNAFPDVIEILTKNSSLLIPERAGVVHFFTGTETEAKKLLDLGFSFTFGGVITFTRDYYGVIRLIPLDRILSETDAPYVAPVPYRGKRNEPSYVIEVEKKLAELKNISQKEMGGQILKNVERMFQIRFG